MTENTACDFIGDLGNENRIWILGIGPNRWQDTQTCRYSHGFDGYIRGIGDGYEERSAGREGKKVQYEGAAPVRWLSVQPAQPDCETPTS